MTEKKKDLGIVIGSHTEKIWSDVKREAKILIEQNKDNLIIQNAILKLAEEKIKEEREKWNKETEKDKNGE